MPLQCEIVTQERTVFSAQVDAVNLPTPEGRMGVLPNHMVMLTTLGFGEVLVRRGGEQEYFAIGGGFAEILPDRVTLLADSAEEAEEIDVERAQRARDRAERAMSEGIPEDSERYAQIEASLRRAQIRIEVSRRRGTGRRRRAMPAGGGRSSARPEEPGESE
ncbi:MAG TPA: F0F1 ATP synthase subunit epsilon [Candidatus Binatia bacterium]|jgi:F-type H+-transporting ATPase subunit epsilon|nr:F0F1 ATP synthase subunit epsilon [Candidatus Binatia bacterium]